MYGRRPCGREKEEPARRCSDSTRDEPSSLVTTWSRYAMDGDADALDVDALGAALADDALTMEVAAAIAQARLRDTEMADEGRERAEAELLVARRDAALWDQQSEAKLRKAEATWGARLEAVAREREQLADQLGVQSAAETLSAVHASGIEQQRVELLRRAERAEAPAETARTFVKPVSAISLTRKASAKAHRM